MWYFLYFSANCSARKIDIKNMSIKRDAVARCAGPQTIHCSTVRVEFVSEGSKADVLFSYSFSESINYVNYAVISNNVNNYITIYVIDN